jgi:hypothetical protein
MPQRLTVSAQPATSFQIAFVAADVWGRQFPGVAIHFGHNLLDGSSLGEFMWWWCFVATQDGVRHHLKPIF